MLRSLFALLALAAVTFANCAVYAKEQLPKLCMIRAETLEDGRKNLVAVRPPTHESGTFPNTKMYDKEYGLPRPLDASHREVRSQSWTELKLTTAKCFPEVRCLAQLSHFEITEY